MDCFHSTTAPQIVYSYDAALVGSTSWDVSPAHSNTHDVRIPMHVPHWRTESLMPQPYPNTACTPASLAQIPSAILPPDAQDYLGARLALFSEAPSRIRQWLHMLAHPAHVVRIEPALDPSPAPPPAQDMLYASPSSTHGSDAFSSPASTRASDALPWLPAPYTVPDARTASLQCQWDGCTQRFATTRFGDIEAHLRAAHFAPAAWDADRRGHCRWAGCERDKTLFFKSFAKHIATRHLRSTATGCAVHGCGERFTRADSMARHLMKVHGVGLQD
ncbi:uncharacterized protein FIBRA_06514 [Fibroporia radiculosa]|uniref:C2H2-type domain-containing protein n=1 Tax=Fibroporia radiculosa TaxID=599839 RepID=J4HZ84_9APHY|nr:uncharacterized protein FIBRA_06514 [Fibroporia radiculosa]CCM04342.1 predicted protein [Fibroporia radiculosa]